MSEPYTILKNALEKERRVKELKDANARQNEREIVELVNKVRRAYRSLLIDHAAFVYDTQYDHGNNGGQTENTITNGKETDFRDIAGLLWKSCFYKQIAEFRSSLRKHAAHHDSLLETAQSRAGPSSRHNGEDKNHHHQYPQLGGVSNEQREQAQAERVYIARLNQAFLGFLSDSVAFYQKMVAELEDRARAAREVAATSTSATVSTATRTTSAAGLQVSRHIKSIHRCLLCLGDLSRYKEMYNSEKPEPKEFLESLRYYQRAALIDPQSGNPHNQMAVLATYSDAECVALYHYCRSILSSQPFAGGFENLALLFASNAEAYQKLPPLAPSAAQAGVGGGKPRNSRKPVPLKPFLTRFVYLHGLLFSWTTIMHQSYAQLQDSQESAFSSSAPSFGQQEPLSGSQASSWVPVLKTGLSAPAGGVGGGNNGDNDFDRKYEHFTALLRQVLNEYEVHLTAGNLPDALLVRLLAICLFSVHYAVGKEANLLSYIALAGAKDGGGGSAVQQWLEEQRRHCADPQSQARTGTECLALLMLFGIISRTATRINEMIAANEKGSRSTLNRTLPMLSVFANWACLQDQYLSTPDFPLSPPQHQEQQVSAGLGLGREADLSESDPAASAVAPPALFADSAPAGTPLILTTSQWDRAFLASPELLRAESRARSGVRASVSALKAFITDDLQRNEHFSAKDHQQRSQHSRPHPHRQPVGQSRAGVAEKTEEDDVQFLREHIELRGFLPVSAIVEKSFEAFDPLTKTLNVQSEALGRFNRQSSVVALIRTLLASPAAASTAGPAGTRGGSTLSTIDNRQVAGSAAGSVQGKRDRKQRKDDCEETNAASVADTGSSSQKKGPPALPSHVSYLPGTTQHSSGEEDEEVFLAPSEIDFPELPSRPKPITTATPAPAAAPTATAGTVTAGSSQQEATPAEEDLEDWELELNDTVVFKSAFVRNGNSSGGGGGNSSSNGDMSLLSLQGPSAAATTTGTTAIAPGMSLQDALQAASSSSTASAGAGASPHFSAQQHFSSFPPSFSQHSSTHSLNYSFDNNNSNNNNHYNHSSMHSSDHSFQQLLSTSMNTSGLFVGNEGDGDNDGDLFSQLDRSIGGGLDNSNSSMNLGLDLSMLLEQDDVDSSASSSLLLAAAAGAGGSTGVGGHAVGGGDSQSQQQSPPFEGHQGSSSGDAGPFHLLQQYLRSPSSASFFAVNSSTATPVSAPSFSLQGSTSQPLQQQAPPAIPALSSLFQQSDFSGYWDQLNGGGGGAFSARSGRSEPQQSRLLSVGAGESGARSATSADSEMRSSALLSASAPASAPWTFAQDDSAPPQQHSPYSHLQYQGWGDLAGLTGSQRGTSTAISGGSAGTSARTTPPPPPPPGLFSGTATKKPAAGLAAPPPGLG